jgi:hypothetical protein
MGSGKDTVAESVVKRLQGGSFHESFASPLRDEVNGVIETIKNSDTRYEAVISTIMGVGIEYDPIIIQEVVFRLYDDVKNHGLDNVSTRTDSTRFALQRWGTEVRRAVHPDYWVDKIRPVILDKMRNGFNVYLTDARFPNELDMVRSLNGLTIRLNVSDDVQSRRIMKRDHVEVTPEMRSHPSETASDSYEHYDLVINTDYKSVGEITKIILDKI